jgi:hypothetical protein
MKFYSLLFESNSLTSWAKVWLDDGADSFQAGFRAWEARNEGLQKIMREEYVVPQNTLTPPVARLAPPNSVCNSALKMLQSI